MSLRAVLLVGFAAAWLGTSQPGWSQGTIAYYQPPSPIVLWDPGFGQQYPLDFDGDANTDFTFTYSFIFLGVRSEGANRLLIIQDPPPNIGGPIAPLPAELLIGPSTPAGALRWWAGSDGEFDYLADYYNGSGNGPFAGQRAYMGVEFQRAGQAHYGWALLQVSGDYAAIAAIESWAWETRPGEAILAGAVPEPSVWALLVSGGFLFWWYGRKKRMA